VDADSLDWRGKPAGGACDCPPRTALSIRQRFVQQGLEAALPRQERARPCRAPLLDGDQPARLVQTACRQPPDGRARWTL
jgi:hypothetical protein